MDLTEKPRSRERGFLLSVSNRNSDQVRQGCAGSSVEPIQLAPASATA
jgi:hypothetical protein